MTEGEKVSEVRSFFFLSICWLSGWFGINQRLLPPVAKLLCLCGALPLASVVRYQVTCGNEL